VASLRRTRLRAASTADRAIAESDGQEITPMSHHSLVCSPFDAPATEQGGGASAVADVRRFAYALRQRGFTAHVTRMLWDPIYARGRIAFAHTLADDALRAQAVQLFRHYEAIAAPRAHFGSAARHGEPK
jgi:hypothetical protein